MFEAWKLDPERLPVFINKSIDLLANIDGIIVLAPKWKLVNDSIANDELASINPSTPLNQKVYFNKMSSASNDFLLDGWGSQENWGTWSTATSSNLIIPPPDKNYKTLGIGFRAFITPKHPVQSFEVFINGKLVSKFQVSDSTSHQIKIQLDNSQITSPFFRIEIRSLTPQSPHNVSHGSNDYRLLGFGLESIIFQ